MRHVILTIGISASGKTTWANEKVKSSFGGKYVNINRDDLRFSLFGCSGWKDYRFSKDKENIVSKAQLAIAKEAISSGKSIIISDTNLKAIKREKWKSFAKEHGCLYEEEVFHIDLEEAQKRNAYRANGVPPDVIYKQYELYKEEFVEKAPEYDPELPDCIICDLDGTLALHTSGRSPFDWERVGEDTLNVDVYDFIKSKSVFCDVIFMSGRDSVCRKETEQWLEENGLILGKDYTALFMRKEGDNRKDTVIKKELYEDYVKNKYNVKLILDDRPCVIRTWLNMGLKVWAVSNPYLEF